MLYYRVLRSVSLLWARARDYEKIFVCVTRVGCDERSFLCEKRVVWIVRSEWNWMGDRRDGRRTEYGMENGTLESRASSSSSNKPKREATNTNQSARERERATNASALDRDNARGTREWLEREHKGPVAPCYWAALPRQSKFSNACEVNKRNFTRSSWILSSSRKEKRWCNTHNFTTTNEG